MKLKDLLKEDIIDELPSKEYKQHILRIKLSNKLNKQFKLKLSPDDLKPQNIVGNYVCQNEVFHEKSFLYLGVPVKKNVHIHAGARVQIVLDPKDKTSSNFIVIFKHGLDSHKIPIKNDLEFIFKNFKKV